MDFDLQWLLLGLPVMFALGWAASRFDLRQWKREQRESPKAYFKGLNLLLNEQHDKAIDAFIEAVQNDPDTSELHFALGNLFRRRGEVDRAVRVHQHLLNRGDLPQADRSSAIVTWPDPDGTAPAALRGAGIVASGRAGRARVAFHIFNDEADVTRAARALGR